jgi:hypothetical protein
MGVAVAFGVLVAVGEVFVGAFSEVGGALIVVGGANELTALQASNISAANKNRRLIAQLYLQGLAGKIN